MRKKLDSTNERAIVEYNKAITINPKNASAYWLRGRSWARKGNLHNALGDADRAIELMPDFAAAKEDAEAYIKALKSEFPSIVIMPPDPQVSPVQPALPVTAATRRVALLIGNSRYQHEGRLENPANDVELIARALRTAGFSSVEIKKDLTAEQMRRAVRDFGAIADSADFAFVHYAGHAIQVGGVNYLIPVDAKLRSDRDIELETIAAQTLMSALSGSKKLKVLVLDACRNNPFERQMQRTIASRSLGRGLSRMEPTATGELIVFAAAAGEVAEDGQGSNSSFAIALAKYISSNPPLEVRRLFDVVRDDVLRMTQRKQQPFSYGSVSGREDFYFTR